MWPSIIAAARAACSPSRFGRVESEAISSSIGRLRRTGQTCRSITSVAGARLIDDDAQQLQGNLGAEAVEFLGGRADRVTRPAGAAGMAVGEDFGPLAGCGARSLSSASAKSRVH